MQYQRNPHRPLHVTALLGLSKTIHYFSTPFILEKSFEREFIVQDIGFTVRSKNLSFTHRLSGHFLDVLWNQELVLENVSN